MTTATATEASALSVVPDSLGGLTGPADGEITLPVEICWYLPDRTFNLGVLDDRLEAYEAVLGNGTDDDARKYLNAGRLTEVLPLLGSGARRRVAQLRPPLAAAA